MTLIFSCLHFSTKPSFHILSSSASRAHPSQDYEEQKAVVVVKHHYQGCQLARNVLVHESISEA